VHYAKPSSPQSSLARCEQKGDGLSCGKLIFIQLSMIMKRRQTDDEFGVGEPFLKNYS
jgi:hypothetical protein